MLCTRWGYFSIKPAFTINSSHTSAFNGVCALERRSFRASFSSVTERSATRAVVDMSRFGTAGGALEVDADVGVIGLIAQFSLCVSFACSGFPGGQGRCGARSERVRGSRQADVANGRSLFRKGSTAVGFVACMRCGARLCSFRGAVSADVLRRAALLGPVALAVLTSTRIAELLQRAVGGVKLGRGGGQLRLERWHGIHTNIWCDVRAATKGVRQGVRQGGRHRRDVQAQGMWEVRRGA